MSKYSYLNRTMKQVSKSSHQPASTEEQKLAASDPRSREEIESCHVVRVPDRPCLFKWSLKQATSLTISAPWGKEHVWKKMLLPRFYQWTEFHPRLFVVKWTEVKAWLPTRFCYGLMHIDLQEWYCWKKSGMLSHVSHVYCYILSAA